MCSIFVCCSKCLAFVCCSMCSIFVLLDLLDICVLLNVIIDMCAAQYECITQCARHRVHCFMCSCMFDNFTYPQHLVAVLDADCCSCGLIYVSYLCAFSYWFTMLHVALLFYVPMICLGKIGRSEAA